MLFIFMICRKAITKKDIPKKYLIRTRIIFMICRQVITKNDIPKKNVSNLFSRLLSRGEILQDQVRQPPADRPRRVQLLHEHEEAEPDLLDLQQGGQAQVPGVRHHPGVLHRQERGSGWSHPLPRARS